MKKIIRSLSYMLTFGILLFSVSCNNKEDTSVDEATIRNIYKEFSDAVASKDINKIMSIYAPGNELLAFDAFIPRQYKGVASYQKDYENFLSAFPGPARSTISDLTIKISGNLAYASCIDQWTVTDSSNNKIDMILRCTDVLEKKQGKWQVIHEHISCPIDPATGKADYVSK